MRVALNPNDQLSSASWSRYSTAIPPVPIARATRRCAGTITAPAPTNASNSGGLPIAVTGNPGRLLDNDWGFYGIIDQLIWRLPGSEDVKGVGLFGRVIGAPSDQNLVDFYADGGITFTGMIPRRPDDLLAVGFAYTGISNSVHDFDLDSGLPVARTREALLEICYTFQLRSGWTLQPDFQYIWQPGGNVPNGSGNSTVENAPVLGARTTISF